MNSNWTAKRIGVLAGLIGATAIVCLLAGNAKVWAQYGDEGRYGKDPLVGTWRLEVTVDGAPDANFEQIQNYNSDGTIVAYDSALPPSQETISLGPWKRVHPWQYVEDDYQMVADSTGNVVCKFVVHAITNLDPHDPDRFTGPYSYKQTCPDGTVTTGSGQSTGYRLKVY
jgi:hypothetical protein